MYLLRSTEKEDLSILVFLNDLFIFVMQVYISAI